MTNSELSDKELTDAFNSLKNKRSAGFDQISSDIVKNVAHEIFDPLKFVINLSIIQGKVPDKIKIARVVPVFKSGDKTLINNYRPISILPCFS